MIIIFAFVPTSVFVRQFLIYIINDERFAIS